MAAKIRNFNCTYSNSVGVSAEVTDGLGLEFPDAYRHRDTMAVLAKAIEEHDGAGFCLLPFCRTVEVEAMGADINYGDANQGPRARNPICETSADLLALPEIDFSTGRVREVLEACRLLEQEGETVCLEIVGPFTMLTALMEARKVFKMWRKEREAALQVMGKLGAQLLRYVDEAREAGVDIITYSDSAGSLDILGPRVMEEATREFTYGFVKELQEHIDDQMIVQLCPKFAFALLDTGLAEVKVHDFGEKVDFLDAMLALRGKAKILGQACIKDIGVSIGSGHVQELVLL